jgi:hypothetical protein
VPGGAARSLALGFGQPPEEQSGRVFQAAPLDRRASVKGGPYSEGTSVVGGQFGLVTVRDQGAGPVEVTLSGSTYTGAEVLHYEFAAGARGS